MWKRSHMGLIVAQLSMLVVSMACLASPANLSGGSEDEHYALFIEGIVNRSLEWLGDLPSPTAYCVLITTESVERTWEGARPPSRSLLERLNNSGDITYYSYEECTMDAGAYSPAGDRAGTVWAQPLSAAIEDHLIGGWFGVGEMTTWKCSLERTRAGVELKECDLLEES